MVAHLCLCASTGTDGSSRRGGLLLRGAKGTMRSRGRCTGGCHRGGRSASPAGVHGSCAPSLSLSERPEGDVCHVPCQEHFKLATRHSPLAHGTHRTLLVVSPVPCGTASRQARWIHEAEVLSMSQAREVLTRGGESWRCASPAWLRD